MKLKNLLGTSTKIIKGEKYGYLTGILYLSPHSIVNGLNLCRYASASCKASCLYTAGRGAFSSVQKARIVKTELFRDNPKYFLGSLVYSIEVLVRQARRKGLIPIVRLNGTSDISWEGIFINGKTIFQHFPNVQFYDYTKNFTRRHALTGKIANYHLTFSYSGSNLNKCLEMLKMGVNVAMIFDRLPESYNSYNVIDGDIHDLRFLDKRGVIIGLTPKGKARKDLSTFVIKTPDNFKAAY